MTHSVLNNWEVNEVIDMSSLCVEVVSTSQPLDNWDVRNVTDKSPLFSGATSFNHCRLICCLLIYASR